MKQEGLAIIGSTAYVSVCGIKHIPAKVDTGADTSSIWASHIRITPDHYLECQLFDVDSSFYTGETLRFAPGEYQVNLIKTSTGQPHQRYIIHLPLEVCGRKIRASFSLSDRSSNSMPILIGRRTLAGKFCVDVRENPTGRKHKFKKSTRLTAEMRSNPYAFHLKYNGASL